MTVLGALNRFDACGDAYLHTGAAKRGGAKGCEGGFRGSLSSARKDPLRVLSDTRDPTPL